MDIIKILIALILFIGAILLGLPPLIKYFPKILPKDTLSIVMLIVNFSALVVMIAAIIFSSKSSMDQIKTLEENTSQQISEAKRLTDSQLLKMDEQIETIRTSTKQQIDKINALEKTKTISLIKALLYETEANIKFVQDITEEYNKSHEKIPNKLYGIFLIGALDANLVNNTIQDKDILASLTRLKVLYMISNQIIQDANSLQTKNQFVNKTIMLERINDTQNESLKNKLNQKYALLPETISLRVDKYFHLTQLFGDNEETINSIIDDIKKYEAFIKDNP